MGIIPDFSIYSDDPMQVVGISQVGSSFMLLVTAGKKGC